MLTLANGYRVAIRHIDYFGAPAWRVTWNAPTCPNVATCRCGTATHSQHAAAIETVCTIAARRRLGKQHATR